MKTKKRKRISLSTKHSLYGHIFAAPFIIGFVLFFLSPLVLFISMSFNDIGYNNQGMVFKFAGFAYYKIILVDSVAYLLDVYKSLSNIGIILPVIVIYSFFIATMLNQKFKGRAFFRAAFFLPVITATGIQALKTNDWMMQGAVSAASGTSAAAKDTLNFSGLIINLLGPDYQNIVMQYIQPLINNIYIIVLSSGVQILIFLAAIQTVPPSIYEAARIDGATPWESFWKITLPYLSPMIIVNSVYTLIDLLGGANNIVVSNIYDLIAVQNRFSVGAAQGTVYFSLIFILMMIVILIMSRFAYYEDRS
ncbi:MAG: carbohydrate ABC transporter permease [Saccharofermentanales bacterium]